MPVLSLGNQSFNVDSSGVATGANAAGSSAITNLTGGNSYSSYTPPNTAQPVPSSSLGSSPLNLPVAPVQDNGSSVVAQAISGNNATNAQTAAQTPPTSSTPSLDAATSQNMATTGDYTQDPGYQQAQGNLTSAQQSLTATENALPSQAALLAQNQQSTGATANLQTVQQLTSQLAAQTAAYNNKYQQIGTQGVQAGVPDIFTQGQQAAEQRQAAVLTAGTAAQLQAAQGNYTQSEALAEQAANLQFADAQQKVNTLKDFVSMNQNNLSQAEKVATSKMQAQATQMQTQIDNQKAAVSFAMTNNITQPFYNIGGTIYNTKTGAAYSTPAQFFAAGGAQDFSNAQVVNSTTTASKTAVVDLANKYPDAKINLNDSLGAAQDKVTANSAIYKNSVRLLGSGSGGGGGSSGYIPGANPVVDAWIKAVQNGNATMAQVPAANKNDVALGLAGGTQSTIVNPSTDAQVKAIIAANPGQYGNAANAIDKAFGAGTATKYDAQLKAVYNQGQDVASAFGEGQSYSPLASSRFATASNRIVNNFVQLPAYQLTANGLPYIQRIQAAIQTPGSISDQELLDAMTKLSTSGNAVTDAQIKVITGGQSYADQLNVFKNKLSSGGVLSDQQRQDLVATAQNIYSAYSKAYQPVYDQATSQLTAAGIPQAFWTIPDLNSLSGQSQGGQTSQVYQLNGVNYVLGQDGNYYPQ